MGQTDVKRKKQKHLIGWFLSFYTVGLFKMNHPMIIQWLSKSSDYTICDYTSFRYVEDAVVVLSFKSSTNEELKN